MRAKRKTREVPMGVLRDGEPLTLTVRVGRRPHDQ
jgi:hypothetical protein